MGVEEKMQKKAVILFSGGLDSTTCLAIAKSQRFECYTISVDYGQRHRYELENAKKLSKTMGAKDHKVVVVSLDAIGGSALTDNKIDVPDFTGSVEIPNTYVPARNTIFLSIALGYAEVLGASDIFVGANELDYSGYPDCRTEYFKAYEAMANLATKAGVEGKHVKIQTPLLRLNKRDIIKKGIELGVDFGSTFSCYRPNAEGRACGSCDSCTYRKRGFAEAGVVDPTRYG